MERTPSHPQSLPGADAAKAEVWLRGHLGHLTKEQQNAFTAFKSLCTEQGYYTPTTADKPASHEDALMM